ncbi:HD domain-containing protein [Roseateles sp. DAIF2]|uniref:HD domain-containing phosphohydrolase n=1 Tax=Roseateles sp. DAIF2 TaxID=2714952 RepID=UPI0018A26DD0|nr:HD domain-containing phosphohydrolase [Roseateles sp. DAIF2]QPF72822.1 HD domain-containing protein [Roseateles sp. DAIF2]
MGIAKPRSIYLTLSVLMIGIVLLLYAALASYQLSVSKQRMLAQAADTFERIGRETSAAIEAELRPARLSAALLAQTSLLAGARHADRLARLPLLAAALRQNPSLSAVYGGTANGSFVLLRRLDPRQEGALEAPPGSAYLLQSVDRDGAEPRGSYRFFDAELRLLAERERPGYRFDPRERAWFVQAVAARDSGAVVQTSPYLFFTTREVGLTLASAGGTLGAAGVDVSLQALAEMLARQRITPGSELMIVDAQGGVLALAAPGKRLGAQALARGSDARLPLVRELGSPVLLHLWERAQTGTALEPITGLQGREWVLRLQALAGAPGLSLAIAAPRDELQADALRARSVSLLIASGIVLLTLPLVHWAAQLVAQPLKRLAAEAEAISRFEFEGPEPARSHIREVDMLALAMGRMRESLRRFLQISEALAAEHRVEPLLQRLLGETVSVVQASSGAIHLVSDDGQRLVPAAALIDGVVSDPGLLSTWALDERGSPSVTVRALRENRLVDVELRWEEASHLSAYGGLFRRLEASRLRMLALPLRNQRDELVGTLSFTFVDEQGSGPLPAARAAFIQALAGPAAVAIDNQLLLRTQKALLESLIQLVAGAIDAKSPYTGGHCQRVPELTKMLARAACAADSGPYRDFRLDEEDWEALHIAAWLHDCGKVTTPEYVVDKATKLETIHDRIHEIRMRFELLKQEAYLALCEQRLRERDEDLPALRAAAAPAQAALDEDFAFIAACNEGGEFLSPDKLARLQAIAQRRWWRTLDDRLGLSHAERERLAAFPAPALPVQEPLLADKPEHRLRRPARELIPDDNRWGFRMRVPEHLYDRGELHNLSVSRGTLTEEERYKINEHIVQTIKMLSELPFPPHLKSVPEIAGGHHERMDGGGYPRGLTREQMSPQARMMAIADVFEALTADDRPYKKGKRLSEALAIMARMAREQHLDGELFELFLRAGVCLDYARRFMRPEQVDAVRIEDYLS